MILGFTPFTWFHTILSLVALVAGFVVVRDLFASRTPPTWTAVYIATAVLTSVTGFGFDFPFGASHVVGIISLAILVAVIAAYYVLHLSGPWRWIYAISQVLVLYFLVFVLVAQFFKKVPALTALAPTLSEPPFAIAQTVVLVIFAWLTYSAARAFMPRSA
jgi:hypothetical protein